MRSYRVPQFLLAVSCRLLDTMSARVLISFFSAKGKLQGGHQPYIYSLHMDAAAELGRNPVSKDQILPEYRDEQGDAGRDCRTRLARPNSQALTRTGEYSFYVQLTTSRIGNLTRSIHTLAICVTIHTHYYYIRYFVQQYEHKYCRLWSFLLELARLAFRARQSVFLAES